MGKFEDKLMSSVSLKTPSFPKFYSYENDIVIKEIPDNVKWSIVERHGKEIIRIHA